MIDERFVFLGIVFSIVGCLDYLINTLKGKTKPNKVTWFLWAFAPLIAFAAQIQEGVGLSAWMTFIVGFCPLLIFLASFINKQSDWQLSRFDLACGGLSVIGLVLWFLTKEGNIAIIFSVLADALASLPTIVKSYQYPETESSTTYLLSGLNGFITLLTLKTWTFAYYGFPLYIFLDCLVIYLLVQFKLGKSFNIMLARVYKK